MFSFVYDNPLGKKVDAFQNYSQWMNLKMVILWKSPILEIACNAFKNQNN